jgi:Flp pilus assembly protein TadG
VSRWRSERGQSAVELMGLLWLLLTIALVIWQILLAAWTGEQAQNAARTASRVAGRGGDAEKAGVNAVPGALRKDMKVDPNGERVDVYVHVPIIVPGLVIDSKPFTVHRWAVLPNTSATT